MESPKQSSGARIIPVMDVLFLLACIIFIASAWKVQQDDAYIFYTYAENIANGNGYVFNIGENINGTTSALYPLLLALVLWVTNLFNLNNIAPFIGFTITTLSLWVIGIIGMRLLYRRGLLAASLTFPFFLLLSMPFFVIGALGMDTYLMLALIMGATYAYDSEKYNIMGILCGLATLARPDAIILAGVIFLHYFITRRRFPPLIPIILYIAVLIPWLTFSQLTFGSILPLTLSAKSSQASTGFWGTGPIYITHLVQQFARRYSIITFFAVISTPWLFYRYRNNITVYGFMQVLLFWALLHFIGYAIINPPGYIWYYTPYSILIAGSLALAFEIITGQPSRNAGALKLAMPLLILILLFINVVLNVQRKDPRLEAYRTIATWFNERTEPGTSIGANEIGIFGYYYENGPVIDGLGLVTEGVADHIAEGDYSWYVREYEPDYLMFFYPNLKILEDMVEEAWFEEQYELVEIIVTDRKQMAIYQRR